MADADGRELSSRAPAGADRLAGEPARHRPHRGDAGRHRADPDRQPRASGSSALVLFCLAALTDFLDGWVARARGEVSPLGVFMDLTADKVLVGGVLVAMVEVGLLPTWMVATILVRELVIAGVRQMAAAENVVIPARALGKAKTLTTLVGMAVLLLAHDALTGGPLAATGIGAGRRGRRLLADGRSPPC